MPGGTRTEIHLDGTDTGGAFCLLVDNPPGGWSLAPHLHTDSGRRLLTFSPAGMEEFFCEAGAPSPEAEPDRAGTAAAVRHGWRFVD
jgi:hypothetical protein